MLQPGPLKAVWGSGIELDHGPTTGPGKSHSAQNRLVLTVVSRICDAQPPELTEIEATMASTSSAAVSGRLSATAGRFAAVPLQD